MYCCRKVTNDLIWVGANDRRLAMFEGVYSVPRGVSYNSYLLTDEKTVLFDTVDGDVIYTIRPGTQSGTRVRLRGKGVPSVRNKDIRGDHYCQALSGREDHLQPEACGDDEAVLHL